MGVRRFLASVSIVLRPAVSGAGGMHVGVTTSGTAPVSAAPDTLRAPSVRGPTHPTRGDPGPGVRVHPPPQLHRDGTTLMPPAPPKDQVDPVVPAVVRGGAADRPAS